MITTDVPTGPLAGLRPVMFGAGTTVNDTPALVWPFTVTTTFPLVAPPGIAVAMLVVVQLLGVNVVPFRVTVFVPCVGPKLVPVMDNEEPMAPDVGDKLVMLGGTVKVMPLLT